jgi:hypothetical protein
MEPDPVRTRQKLPKAARVVRPNQAFLSFRRARLPVRIDRVCRALLGATGAASSPAAAACHRPAGSASATRVGRLATRTRAALFLPIGATSPQIHDTAIIVAARRHQPRAEDHERQTQAQLLHAQLYSNAHAG